MTIDCPICGFKNIDKKHPYSQHKIKYKDLIEKYYPRTDLYTGGKIEFKSLDSYFLTDFNDKRNLKSFLEEADLLLSFQYLKDWLLRRVVAKPNFNFNLTEFEAKTLMFPAPSYILKKYGQNSYRKLTESANLIYRNSYEKIPEFNIDISNSLIKCDSREQKVVNFANMEVGKIEFGDYCIDNSNIYIERKSLSDAISTLSIGYERFSREIFRAVNDNKFLLVVIEESFKNLQSFEYMPHIHSKATWPFISHRIRELMLQYPLNLQFLAVDGRKEFSRVVEKIFKMEKLEKMPDFQYLYNIKML